MESERHSFRLPPCSPCPTVAFSCSRSILLSSGSAINPCLFTLICTQSLPLYFVLANPFRTGAISISARFIRRRVERFCFNGFYFPFDSEVYDLMPFFFPIDRVYSSTIAGWLRISSFCQNNFSFTRPQFCSLFFDWFVASGHDTAQSFQVSSCVHSISFTRCLPPLDFLH